MGLFDKLLGKKKTKSTEPASSGSQSGYINLGQSVFASFAPPSPTRGIDGTPLIEWVTEDIEIHYSLRVGTSIEVVTKELCAQLGQTEKDMMLVGKRNLVQQSASELRMGHVGHPAIQEGMKPFFNAQLDQENTPCILAMPEIINQVKAQMEARKIVAAAPSSAIVFLADINAPGGYDLLKVAANEFYQAALKNGNAVSPDLWEQAGEKWIKHIY